MDLTPDGRTRLSDHKNHRTISKANQDNSLHNQLQKSPTTYVSRYFERNIANKGMQTRNGPLLPF